MYQAGFTLTRECNHAKWVVNLQVINYADLESRCYTLDIKWLLQHVRSAKKEHFEHKFLLNNSTGSREKVLPVLTECQTRKK